MKKLILSATAALIALASFSQTQPNQASPSNLNAPATAQPVPNALSTDKGSPGTRPGVPLRENYIPPVYPGAQPTVPVATQNLLIRPSAPPAPTQPVQKEPLRPVESKNELNPTQPPREKENRVNRPQ